MKSSIPTLIILLITQTILGQKINFKEFIPTGYSILDTSKCDLNQDSLADYIIILKNDLESVKSDTTRPLLIIHGQKDGTFKMVERNERVVLCLGCGGVFGDPYAGITVKNNYFSIQHYGGSGWRWTRIITFKYDKKLKKYILHKDAGESFHATDPDKTEYHTYNKDGWDKLQFENYKIEW